MARGIKRADTMASSASSDPSDLDPNDDYERTDTQWEEGYAAQDTGASHRWEGTGYGPEGPPTNMLSADDKQKVMEGRMVYVDRRGSARGRRLMLRWKIIMAVFAVLFIIVGALCIFESVVLDVDDDAPFANFIKRIYPTYGVFQIILAGLLIWSYMRVARWHPDPEGDPNQDQYPSRLHVLAVMYFFNPIALFLGMLSCIACFMLSVSMSDSGSNATNAILYACIGISMIASVVLVYMDTWWYSLVRWNTNGWEETEESASGNWAHGQDATAYWEAQVQMAEQSQGSQQQNSRWKF